MNRALVLASSGRPKPKTNFFMDSTFETESFDRAHVSQPNLSINGSSMAPATSFNSHSLNNEGTSISTAKNAVGTAC